MFRIRKGLKETKSIISRSPSQDDNSNKENNPSEMDTKKFDHLLQSTAYMKEMFSQSSSILEQAIKNSNFDQNTIDARDFKWIMDMPSDVLKQLSDLQESEYPEISKWIGKMFFRIVSASFDLFTQSFLTYDEAKVHLCENMLINTVNLYAAKIANKDKAGQFGTFVNKKCVDVLEFLMTKYPQTKLGNPNKALEVIVKPINNLASFENDMLINSGITFKLKDNGDYTQQIMKVINHILTLPSKPIDQFKKTNAQFFISFFEQVFQSILEPTHLDQTKMTEAEFKKARQEYREKQKKISTFYIGRKIPENTPLFTDDEIQSEKFSIKAPGIMRVMTKWLENLSQILENPDKNVSQRNTRFKGNDGSAKKVYAPFKKVITKTVKSRYKEWKRQIFELVRHCNIMQQQVGHKLYDMKKLNFLQQNDSKLGDFAVKMEKIASQYLLHALNKTIYYLNKIVEDSKRKMMNAMSQDKQFDEISRDAQKIKNMMDIELTQLKLGDLLRCKCASSEKNIIKVYNKLIQACQKDPTHLEIVRIKNRLNKGTQDILINILLNKQILCQVQLGIQSEINQKQNFYDKFNHILYQIKRARFGPVIQAASQWCNFDQRSISFRMQMEKHQKSVNSKYRKYSHHKCPKQFIKPYSLPFICNCCDLLISRCQYLFGSITCTNCDLFVCGRCLNLTFKVQEKLQFIFGQKISQFCPYIGQYTKNMLQEWKKHPIPINGILVKKHRMNKHLTYFHIESEQCQDVLSDGEDQVENCNSQNMIYTIIESKYNKQFNLLKPPQKSINIIAHIHGKFQQQMKQILSQNFLFYFHAKDSPYQMLQLETIQNIEIEKISKILLRDNSKRNKEENLALIHNKSQFYYYNIKQLNQGILFPVYDLETVMLQKAHIEAKKIVHKIISEESVGVSISNPYVFKEIKEKQTQKCFQKIRQLYYYQNTKYKSNNWNQQLKTISLFKNLRVCQLYQTQIRSNIFSGLEQLEDLNAYQVEITNQILAQMGPFPNIKILSLSSNNITSMKQFDRFKSLVELQIDSNQILQIYPLQLPNLKQFVLDYNKIKTLQKLQGLKNLNFLSIASNQIEVIQNLSCLTFLQYLNLSDNQIERVQSLKYNKSLQNLQLSNNCIYFIGDQIVQLTNLKVLNLEMNCLDDIGDPQQIQRLIILLNILKNFDIKLDIDQLKFNLQEKIKNPKKIPRIASLKQMVNRLKPDLEDGIDQSSLRQPVQKKKNRNVARKSELDSLKQTQKRSISNLSLFDEYSSIQQIKNSQNSSISRQQRISLVQNLHKRQKHHNNDKVLEQE